MKYTQIANFAKLYSEINSYIKKRTKSYKLSYSDVEDICQSVWLTLCEKNLDFSDEGHMKCWFISTAKNRIIDFYRKAENAKSIDIDDSMLEATTEDKSLNKMILDISSEIDFKNNLNRLEPDLRRVLELRFEQQCTIDEICVITNNSKAVVKSQLMTGKRMYRNLVVVAG